MLRRIHFGTLLDIRNNKFKSTFIFPKPFEVQKVESYILKTKRVNYYSIKEIEINDLSEVSGVLKLLNNTVNKN